MADGNRNDNNNAAETLWIFLFALLTPLLLWFIHKDSLIGLSIFLLEPQFAFYINAYPSLLPDHALAEMEYFMRSNTYLYTTDSQFTALLSVWNTAGIGARVIVAPIFVYWLWMLWRTEDASMYRGSMDREKLVRKMAPHFSNLPPIIGENIHKLPLHLGPWRVPRSYLHLACENQLLLYKKKDVYPEARWTHEDMSLSTRKKRRLMADSDYLTLNREKTDAFFRGRLGSAFTSFNDMPTEHMKALCGLYCALIAKGFEALDEVHEAESIMARSFKMEGSRKKDHGHKFSLNPQPGLDLLNKYGTHEDVLEVISKHHFNITVVMGLYHKAGSHVNTDKFVKLTTNTTIWCRPMDNRLYRCLVQIGGRAAIPEVAGEWAHFNAELRWGGKIDKPIVEGATDALMQALVSENWISGLPGMNSDPFQVFLQQSESIARGHSLGKSGDPIQEFLQESEYGGAFFMQIPGVPDSGDST
ncbi:hypothetical protein N9L54_01475 [Porticoccaceae bacterium]|nr:hypothetical protein [Porticoccaceae bacterium]MDA8788827.1 hypothetical protein [Porticoccaceae bacterium]MDB2343173.1 hypothetical protein [Porticoccaceae bacterium]MDB2664983.1 hypothetical protein [Porticoccaceae bacterium]